MWWLLFVAGFIAFLVFCVLFMEFRMTTNKRHDRTTDASTNHQILHQQSDSLRNQSGFI